MSYLLSIVIPTKNRYKYLLDTIESLLCLDSKLVEIVVMDNSDDNTDFLEFMKKVKNENLMYYHTNKPMGQRDNSDEAIQKCSGKYICYIGDDDSVTSKILDAVGWMDKNNVDAINCSMVSFDWKDVVYGTGRKRKHLRIPYYTKKISKVDTKKVLMKTLKQGAQNIKYLPRVYHAVISKECMEKIKKETGTYFPGESPDMANAIAVALMINEHYYWDEPLVISGTGYDSAAGKCLRGEHKGTLKEAKQLSEGVEKDWDNLIPKIWVGNAIWLQSAIQAIQAMNKYEEYKEVINYYPMYARIYIKFSEYRREISDFCPSFREKIKLMHFLNKESLITLVKKLKQKVSFILGTERDDILEIKEAVKYVNETLN